MAKTVTKETPPMTAGELVHNFLKQNNIRIQIDAVDSVNEWVNDGYLLNDKPLLKVRFEFNTNKAN